VPANTLLDLPDGRTGINGGLTLSFNQPSTSYTFWVRRGTSGQPTTLPMIVTDGCGPWETLVGGGTNAAF
jgi:hypothetical protein